MYLVFEIGIYNGCGEFEFNNKLYEKRLYFYKDILLYGCILKLDNDLFFHSYTFFVELYASHILYNNYYYMPSCIWSISSTYCQINLLGRTPIYNFCNCNHVPNIFCNCCKNTFWGTSYYIFITISVKNKNFILTAPIKVLQTQ